MNIQWTNFAGFGPTAWNCNIQPLIMVSPARPRPHTQEVGHAPQIKQQKTTSPHTGKLKIV